MHLLPHEAQSLPPTWLAGLRPMLLDDRKCAPFSHPDWLFEIKHDGYRLLALFGGGRVDLRTRNGMNCTRWFPEVCRALATYAGGPHLVDGEICVLDGIGRSDFDRLHERAARQCWHPGCDPVTFCMFDLLAVDGRSIMELPLALRKQLLTALFTPKPRTDLLVVESIPEHGLELYAAAVALQLEGLVAKRADSTYVPDSRCSLWRKLKRPGAVLPGRFSRR